LIIIGSIILLRLAYWRAGLLGIFCVGAYLSITSLSLLIVGDAAMHFGINSLYYQLNPLGNQLDRQLSIQVLGYAIIAALLLGKNGVPRIFNVIVVNQKWSVFLITVIVVCAYFFLNGPAIGSEFLKIGLAFLAGALMADQGRILHLIRKYSPQSLEPHVIWNAAVRTIKGQHRPFDATHRVLSHVALPLLSLTGFGFAMLATVALVFHDLGGSVIGALVFVTSLFLVFGSRPAFLSLAVMACAGLVLSHTEKVQKRIELMLDPMTAAISDFARLKAFSEASVPSGFGFGRIAWCNEQGTCLPLQALSDYVPTLLDGLAGPLAAKIFFLVLCLYFMSMAGLACWRFLTGPSDSRAISMATFFLLLASLLQTIITFFGNWRLIPLTGLGVPLLGIGISTMLAPTLAIGFLLISQKARGGAA
jgi:cell division protein FtsW (lipid II flippase)